MPRYLVIQTASIGDVILVTPLVECLHRMDPGAEITLLVRTGHESLFTGHPFLREVMVWEKARRKYRNLFNLILTIRRHRFDVVINCQRFASTGLLTGFSGAPDRRGFRKNPLSFLFSSRAEHQLAGGTHEAARNLSLAGKMASGCSPKPKLYPSEKDTERISEYTRGVYYTVSPASLWFTKQYPAERWAELIREIPAGRKIYLLGSAADKPLCSRIVLDAGHPGAISLAGGLSLLASAALMKGARMNFTNDSAPMHLASAVNAPVTALFCSTLPSFGFGPLSDNSSVAETDRILPCRPCGIHGQQKCPEGHFDCAYSIDIKKLTGRI